jgi:O-antigen ligase
LDFRDPLHPQAALRTPGLLDRLALFLTILGFLLREGVSGADAGSGLNLFIHLLFWIALTIWFAGRAVAGGALYRFTGFEFAFLAFACISLISVQRASFKLPALDHAMAYFSYALFFVLCVNVLGKRRLLALLLPTCFMIALYALVQYFVIFPELRSVADETGSVELARRIRTNEVFSTFLGPNQLAGFLALLLPIVAGAFLDERRPLRGLSLLPGIVTMALTGSLGGWVALACGAVAFSALALTRSRGRGLVTALGTGAAALVVALFLWTPLLSKLSGSHSLAVRAIYWQATGRIIAQAPVLGVGLDNWQEHYFPLKSDLQQESKKAHNDYLQILAEMGLLGFLAFAAIIGMGLRAALVRSTSPTPDPAGNFAWTRIGAAAGLIAFLIHMTVEFDFYEFGVAQALFAVLALVALLRGGAAEVRLSKGICAAAATLLFLITMALLCFVAPRALAADSELKETRQILGLVEGGDLHRLSDATRISQAAQEHNPFEPEAFRLFARVKFHEWDLLRKARTPDEKKLFEIETTILQALDNAIALRPRSSPLHFEKSRLHRLFHRACLKESSLARAQAADHLRLALDHQRRAYELYPTFALNSYHLARLLDLSGDREEARTCYQEALRLSDLAGKEREDLDRLKLDPVARARALHALGRPFEAREILVAHFRQAVAGLPPDEARARLERLQQPGEDEEMRFVLKEVIDALLADLK